MTISIRRLRIGDFDALFNLDRGIDYDFVRRRVQSTKSFVLVAFLDKKMVGWIDCVRIRSKVIDFALYVGARFRNRGIGTLLIRRMISTARKIGIEKIFLDVYNSNKRAIHVYKKSGFVPITKPRSWGYDMMRMRLDLM